MTWTVLRPIGNRILVKLDGRSSHRGIIEVPDEWREQPTTGVVVAVGAGRCDRHGITRELDVKVGDRVLFGKWNGQPVEPPEHDPQGEYFMMSLDWEHADGKPVIVQDVYGVEVKP